MSQQNLVKKLDAIEQALASYEHAVWKLHDEIKFNAETTLPTDVWFLENLWQESPRSLIREVIRYFNRAVELVDSFHEVTTR